MPLSADAWRIGRPQSRGGRFSKRASFGSVLGLRDGGDRSSRRAVAGRRSQEETRFIQTVRTRTATAIGTATGGTNQADIICSTVCLQGAASVIVPEDVVFPDDALLAALE